MNEKGQGTTGFLFSLGFIAVVALVLCAAIAPATQTELAAEAANVIEESEPGDISKVIVGMFTANDHAVATHDEATRIQSCLKSKGPYQVWRDQFDKKKFYALCQLENTQWGLAVCTASGANKTMFIPKGGTWTDILNYVKARGTRFTQGLPAGCD